MQTAGPAQCTLGTFLMWAMHLRMVCYSKNASPSVTSLASALHGGTRMPRHTESHLPAVRGCKPRREVSIARHCSFNDMPTLTVRTAELGGINMLPALSSQQCCGMHTRVPQHARNEDGGPSHPNSCIRSSTPSTQTAVSQYSITTGLPARHAPWQVQHTG